MASNALSEQAAAQATAQEGGGGGSSAGGGAVLTIDEFLEVSRQQLGLFRELLEQQVKEDREAETTDPSEALDEVGFVGDRRVRGRAMLGESERKVGRSDGRERVSTCVCNGM